MMLNSENSSFKKHAILSGLVLLAFLGGGLAFAVKLTADINAQKAERDSKVSFNVYCIAPAGNVLFNDTVGEAYMNAGQTMIKKRDSDTYFTSVAGQCKITPKVKS